MPLNGSGSYIPPAPEFPAIPNTIIYAADFNQIILDIASALSLAIFRDGQAAFLANQSMGGHKLTNLATGTNPQDAVNWTQVFVDPNFTGTTVAGVQVTGTRLTVGTVDAVLPASTKIGTRDFALLVATITELNQLAGVTSNVQVQLNTLSSTKANLAGGNTFTGTQNFPADTLGITAPLGDQSLKFATTQFTATAIAAAVSAVGYTDVVFLNSASSPYSITQATAGKLLLIDTSGGDVVVNLPLVTSLALPFMCGVKKSTTDSNTVTVNCAVGNTFDDGTTAKALSTPAGFTLMPDTDPATDVWAAIGFGGINAGPATNSGLTISTDKLLGRNSPGSGALEEIPHATLAEMQTGVVTALRGMSPADIAQAIAALTVKIPTSKLYYFGQI